MSKLFLKNVLIFNIILSASKFCSRAVDNNIGSYIPVTPLTQIGSIEIVEQKRFSQIMDFCTISMPVKDGIFPEHVVGQQNVKDALGQFFDVVVKNHTSGHLIGGTSVFKSLIISGPPGCSKTMLCESFANKNGCILIKVESPLALAMPMKGSRQEVIASGMEILERAVKNIAYLEFVADGVYKNSHIPIVIVFDNMHLLLSSKYSFINTPSIETAGLGLSIPVRDAIIFALESWRKSCTKYGVIGLFTEFADNGVLMPELASKFADIVKTTALDKQDAEKLLKSLLNGRNVVGEFDFSEIANRFVGLPPKVMCSIVGQISGMAKGRQITKDMFPEAFEKVISNSEETKQQLPDGARLFVPVKTFQDIVVSKRLYPELIEVTSNIKRLLDGTKKSDGERVVASAKTENVGITAFVGESGTGKSSIIEAVASAAGATSILEVDLFSIMLSGAGIDDVLARVKDVGRERLIIHIINADNLFSVPMGSALFDKTMKFLADEKAGNFAVLLETNTFNGFEQKHFKSELINRIIEVQLPGRNEVLDLVKYFIASNKLEFDSSVDLLSFSRRCLGLTGSQIKTALIRARVHAYSNQSSTINDQDLNDAKNAVLRELSIFKDYSIASMMKDPSKSADKHCKFKGVSIVPGDEKTRFSDVAGQPTAKDALKDVVDYLNDPEAFTKYGNRAPKGILLYGPPGTGKTLLARALAGETSAMLITVSGSSFAEVYVGTGPGRVRDLFNTARRFSPCIIFIDEFDALASTRTRKSMSSGEAEATLTELLSQMDGFLPNSGIVVIAATNRRDILDKAALRPGRIDRQIEVSSPDKKERQEMINIHLRGKKVVLASSVDIEALAKSVQGFSGAEIENWISTAINLARKNQGSSEGSLALTNKFFEEARDLIHGGMEKREIMKNKELLRATAYHEAGHGLLQIGLLGINTIRKITIVPRANYYGFMEPQVDEDFHSMRGLEAINNEIVVCMGGRAAEDVMFGKRYPGVSMDLKQATNLAYNIIGRFGGDDGELGPVCLEQEDLSEATKDLRDRLVRKMNQEAYAKALAILTKNKALLEKIAQELLENETLYQEDLIKLGVDKIVI